MSDASSNFGPPNIGPMTMCPKFVRGKPISARFEQSSRRLSTSDVSLERFTGTFLRDSLGNTREDYEYFTEGAVPKVFVIKMFHAVSGESIVLLPEHRTGMCFPRQEESERMDEGYAFPSHVTQLRSEEVLLGIPCAVYTTHLESCFEVGPSCRVWIAKGLLLVMREDLRSGADLRLWEVTALDQSEPEAGAFTVPDDYVLTGFR